MIGEESIRAKQTKQRSFTPMELPQWNCRNGVAPMELPQWNCY
ncbi:hypothetical protein [Emticicia agri]|nr:hypothetical protein [Emticicia agri]